MKSDMSPQYHTELEKAAEDRRRSHQLERLKDKQEAQQVKKYMYN